MRAIRTTRENGAFAQSHQVCFLWLRSAPSQRQVRQPRALTALQQRVLLIGSHAAADASRTSDRTSDNTQAPPPKTPRSTGAGNKADGRIETATTKTGFISASQCASNGPAERGRGASAPRGSRQKRPPDETQSLKRVFAPRSPSACAGPQAAVCESTPRHGRRTGPQPAARNER